MLFQFRFLYLQRAENSYVPVVNSRIHHHEILAMLLVTKNELRCRCVSNDQTSRLIELERFRQLLYTFV